MKTVIHLSDVHFGRVDDAVVSAIVPLVHSLEPDVVVVSGDLTQRARPEEFRAAARLEFSDDPSSIRRADFIIVAVPTPIDAVRKPDFGPLVSASETVGGNPARPGGALEWSTRANDREAELSAEFDRARAAEEANGAGAGRRAHDIERLLTDLRAIRPALDALVGVARNVVDGVGVAVLWPALRDFFERWLLQPGEGPRALTLLAGRLGPLASDAACGTLSRFRRRGCPPLCRPMRDARP